VNCSSRFKQSPMRRRFAICSAVRRLEARVIVVDGVVSGAGAAAVVEAEDGAFGGSGGRGEACTGVVVVLVRSATTEAHHLYALAIDMAFSISRGFWSSTSLGGSSTPAV
jgi:hypothetical protein